MIQDIFPNIYDRTYSNEIPSPDDMIIAFRNGMVLLVNTMPGKLRIPQFSDFKTGCKTKYLFRINTRKLFLAEGYKESDLDCKTIDWYSLEMAFTQFPEWIQFAVVTARHLSDWYYRNRYCGCCGSLMRAHYSERAMVCSECGDIVYPVISPVIIVGVTDHDKLLLTQYANRIFLTGANPFVMSYENLVKRALLVQDYLVECQNIAMFSSIRDIKSKKVWQLRRLRALGINGLSIGTESGDDATLLLANKGYTAKELIEQCRKLDDARMEYYFVYMTGLAGKGNGYRNAVNSAKIFSKVNPRFISVDSLTLFPDTELYQMAQRGEFIPAGEKERIEELQVFISNLQIRTHLFANSKSNYYPVTAYFPNEREKVIGQLQYILDTVDESEMVEYRNNLKSL